MENPKKILGIFILLCVVCIYLIGTTVLLSPEIIDYLEIEKESVSNLCDNLTSCDYYKCKSNSSLRYNEIEIFELKYQNCLLETIINKESALK